MQMVRCLTADRVCDVRETFIQDDPWSVELNGRAAAAQQIAGQAPASRAYAVNAIVDTIAADQLTVRVARSRG